MPYKALDGVVDGLARRLRGGELDGLLPTAELERRRSARVSCAAAGACPSETVTVRRWPTRESCGTVPGGT